MDELHKIDKPVAYEIPVDLKDGVTIVLPERVNTDNISLYTHASMDLFKELRENDQLEVEYLETEGGRKWIDRLGASDVTVIGIIVGITTGVMSSAIWYAIQRFAIERSDKKNTRIKIIIANRDNDPAWAWYEFEGTPKEVSRLAERIIDEQAKKDTKD